MNQKSTGVRIAPFAIGIICFVLPFFQVSCDGKKLMQFTGVQLVTGTEMKNPMSEEVEKTEAMPGAVIAVAALIIGAGFCFSGSRGSSIAAAVMGGLATASLLFLKTRLDAEITKEASGMPIMVDYLVGFWIACLASIAGLVLSIIRAKEVDGG